LKGNPLPPPACLLPRNVQDIALFATFFFQRNVFSIKLSFLCCCSPSTMEEEEEQAKEEESSLMKEAHKERTSKEGKKIL